MIKILHVDDEADIRSITKLALESIGGFNVTSCASGKEAMTAVTEAEPDLIVMDVMMPEMDGPTTFAALQKIPGASRVPVIFMTAKSQKDEIDSLMEVGAIGVIAKPFDPMQLSKEVERIWNARPTG
ncbi:response regulator [Nisaea sp.]|uniref:response regulator n=1 Tax=Nisaea sp. TaxID=2024842 RepID=UPI00329992E9